MQTKENALYKIGESLLYDQEEHPLHFINSIYIIKNVSVELVDKISGLGNANLYRVTRPDLTKWTSGCYL